MARAREIKKRIGAVRTIQRITKTMQMIATSKFTSSAQREKAAKPYSERVQQLMREVLTAASSSGDFEHPLIDGPAESPSRERLLVISSNRGLCGAFNATVLRTAMGHVRGVKEQKRELDLDTVGKKAAAFFRFQRVEVDQRYIFGDQAQYDEVERLADQYISEFAEGRYDAVSVAYMQFVSNARQVPRVIQLLPLAAENVETASGPQALYEFSPSAQDILTDLIPVVVKTALFQAFLDAAVSEQIMRMIAMRAATENATGLGKALTRRFNRARQTQITTELMEVIAGAAALE